jgi:WD40 repeat protein
VQIAADVATLPHHTFSGIFQKDPPQSLWTLDHYHSQGYPVISPDGRWLVLTRTGDWFRHGEWLVVVDLKNRTALEQRVPPPGLTPPAVFSLDGTLLLGVVNTPRGHGLARWKMPSLEVSIADLGEGVAISATFTHKQDRVLVMREGGDVTVYDLADGRKRLEVAPHDPSAKFYNSALAVSPDDQLVAAGIIQPGNQWVLWRLDTGERVPATPTKQHLSWGRVAAFDRTGEHIFTGASGWSILSPASGERLFSFPGNGGEAFHYQPTQDLLSAAIGDGRSFGIVNVATGQLVFSVAHAARPPAPLGYADWAAVSPDGKTAYSANYFSVFAWDLTVLERRKPDWLFAGQSAGRLLPIENGARLLALGERLEVWNLATRKLERVQRLDALGLHQSYESVSPEKRRRMIGNFRAGSSLVGIVASGEVAETFDLTTGRRGLALGRTEAEIMAELQTLVSKPNVTREEMIRQGSQLRAEVFPRGGGGDGALSMDASPDGKWLLVTDPQSREHLASLWSLETGHLIRVLGVRSDGPAARVVRMLDRGRLAVIGDDNGGLGFYELNTGDLISRSDGMPSRDNYGVSRAQITEVLATADGKVIYTSDRNQRIARWERFAEGWRKRYEIEFPSTAPLVRLALSPGGTRLAADLFNGSMNGFIAVIDAASGAVRSILNEDTWDVAFVSENQLATSGVRIWTIE